MDRFEYVKLNGKTPTHKLDLTYTYDDVKDDRGFGILVQEPYVIVDIDVDELNPSDTHERLLNLLLDEGFNTRVYKTQSGGYHFWFKSRKELASRSRQVNALTVETDMKAWGYHSNGTPKKAFVVMRDNGVDRELINDVPFEELDEIPRWLTHIKNYKNSTYDFVNMGKGARNDTFHSYILFLQQQRYEKDEIRYILDLINYYILKEPLSDDEFATVTRDDRFKPKEEIQFDDWFTEKGALKHHIFGDYLIQDMNVITVNDMTYSYRDGYYKPTEMYISQKMIQEIPYIKRFERNEVWDYMKIKTSIEPEDIEFEEDVVNIINGRLNLETGEITPHSDEYYDFARVNARYNASARCEATENMLMKVFCNDEQLFKLFQQALGYSLMRHSRHQVAFLLTGEGSNGKSTFLNMIREFVGKENVSSLSLTDVGDKFRPADLQNKLLNIGDDISNITLHDTGKFKNLVSGEGVTVERKNKDPFTLYNYATMWFGANKMPSFADKSHGMERRMVIIPFDAVFSPQDDDYDADIEDKIMTDTARSYLLNLAIEGAYLLRELGTFVKVDRIEQRKEEYKIESSTILSWVEEAGLTREDFIGKPTQVLYNQYRIHSDESGSMKPFHRTTFTKEINDYFNMTSDQERIDGKRVRIFKEIEEIT